MIRHAPGSQIDHEDGVVRHQARPAMPRGLQRWHMWMRPAIVAMSSRSTRRYSRRSRLLLVHNRPTWHRSLGACIPDENARTPGPEARLRARYVAKADGTVGA